jgi:hypothetical protein
MGIRYNQINIILKSAPVSTKKKSGVYWLAEAKLIFIHSLIHSSIHPFIHSVIYSFIQCVVRLDTGP